MGPLLCGRTNFACRFPFHLRPKDKLPFNYMKIAYELVKELDLDIQSEPMPTKDDTFTDARLARIRAYVACQYMLSMYGSTDPFLARDHSG